MKERAFSSEATARSTLAPEAAEPEARFWALTLGSIGVVYGDIGTSPL